MGASVPTHIRATSFGWWLLCEKLVSCTQIPREVVMAVNLAYFCFGVATAYGSITAIFAWERWQGKRKSSRSRGRAYWDAILAEDRRRQALGESDVEFP
mgnify:CR=1 FL=1